MPARTRREAYLRKLAGLYARARLAPARGDDCAGRDKSKVGAEILQRHPGDSTRRRKKFLHRALLPQYVIARILHRRAQCAAMLRVTRVFVAPPAVERDIAKSSCKIKSASLKLVANW